MIANKRMELEDKKSQGLVQNVSVYFKQGSPAGNEVVNVFPILRHFSSSFKSSAKFLKDTQDYIKVRIVGFGSITLNL